jgi:CRISPR/Cas system CSM-associated protein Csm3 (group 7 of RAMP superfamily)
MTKSAEDGDAVDMLPFVSAVSSADVGLALPGSGLKGAIRARAERIVRTVLGTRSTWSADDRKRHREQIDEPSVRELFGLPRPPRRGGGGAPQRREGRGAVSVDTCYSDDLLKASAWNAIATARADTEARSRSGRSPLYKAVNDAGWLDPNKDSPRRFEQAFHVAIDRWLGSAADGFLFSVLEPWDLKWGKIRLQVDLTRLKKLGCRDEALALLLLVLRDLSTGRLPVGYGANRGFGSITVTSIAFRARGSDLDWLNRELPGGDISQLDGKKLDHLQNAWTAWINAGGNHA